MLVSHEVDLAPPRQTARAGRSARLPAIELATFDNLDDVELEWRRFEANADCTPFQTFDWAAAWCRHVGSRLQARPAIVVGRQR